MRFPRNVLTVSERQDIKPNTSIGSWVNGVSIWSYKSSEYVQFGPLTNITVDGGGEGYDAGAKPNLEIIGGGGTGAAGSVVVNGSLTSFDVTEGGSGYTDSPLISIVGGGGSGGTAEASLLVVASPEFWLIHQVQDIHHNLTLLLQVVVDLVLQRLQTSVVQSHL